MRKAVIGVVGVLLLVGTAEGATVWLDPLADFGPGDSGLPAVAEPAPGFYVWANDEHRYSWSVRWTGVYPGGDAVSWAGFVTYSSAGDIAEVSPVLWEPGEDWPLFFQDGVYGGEDVIFFRSTTGAGDWDGFDLRIEGEHGNELTFRLLSAYYPSGGFDVYLGADLVSLAKYTGSGVFRQFSLPAPAPEPTTMLLLGTGLLGLAGWGRRTGRGRKP
ncbi:MAG: hypothetical protein Kow0092_26560 [Deferrisomatales bacterium]